MQRSGGPVGRMMGGGRPLPEGADRPLDRRTLCRVAGFFDPYRRELGLAIVAILLGAGLGLAPPFLLRRIIDGAIPARDLAALNRDVALIVAAAVVAGLAGIAQTYLSTLVGQRVMRDLRNALYAHLQRLPLRFFTTTRTGEIQARLASDVGGVQQVVTETAAGLVSNLITVVLTFGAMWLLDWRLALLALGLLPVFLLLTYRVGMARRRLAGTTQRTVADLSALAEETLSVSGVLLTKTFGRQERAVTRFQAESARLADLQLRQQMVGRWFRAVITTFFAIAPAAVYWVAGRLIIGGGAGLTVGDIVAFTALQGRLFFPLGQLLNVQVEAQGALALFDRIFAYLDLPVTIADRPGAVDLDPASVRGQVRFRDVRFAYDGADPGSGDDRGSGDDGTAAARRPFALEAIDFVAEPGQLVALVGPSGAGKTTVSLLVPRLYDVDAGAVELDGRDVRDVTLASLGRAIGVVTQETSLFNASVGENIRYGRPDASDAEVAAAARTAAIHDRILELPEGYATPVGERGYKLSGGEKQRVAIARVLLKDPRVLILDEATSALDSANERLIQAALTPLMRGRTTLAIAHRLSTVLAADLILVLDRGRIVERGPHAELLARGGLYARLYSEQFAPNRARPKVVPAPAADD